MGELLTGRLGMWPKMERRRPSSRSVAPVVRLKLTRMLGHGCSAQTGEVASEAPVDSLAEAKQMMELSHEETTR